MMFQVYILYSSTKDSFYIGQTIDLENRIMEHNIHLYQNAETRKANDWIIYYTIDCKSRNQAIQIERHIKGMKSKTYIQNMKKYPEMTIKLLEKYS